MVSVSTKRVRYAKTPLAVHEFSLTAMLVKFVNYKYLTLNLEDSLL